jgi:hypothetical protein
MYLPLVSHAFACACVAVVAAGAAVHLVMAKQAQIPLLDHGPSLEVVAVKHIQAVRQ